MNRFKMSQLLYNKLHSTEDSLRDKSLVILNSDDQIVDYGIKYFNEELSELVYPAKSYSVAIVYSYLLAKNFGESFFDSLNDPDLLCQNDIYFKPYSAAKLTYDKILNGIGFFEATFALNENLSQIKTTTSCFHEEFYRYL